MKLHDCEQGSARWYELRVGVPTASQFHRIVTPGGKLSKQARGYAFRLAAETLLGRSLESLAATEWMDRGKELEPEAVRMYEFDHDAATRPVGFVTTDDGRLGASPDRLVEGARAALEIKCPAPQTHLEYMLDGFGADYLPQVQGQLLVGEFDWVDRYSYHPEMPPVLARTGRDEAYIAILRAALAEFCDLKDELVERARRAGLFAERREILRPIDQLAEILALP
ncbi:MAG TPA: YqaJ viral recombinase family protein, partial [Stellaceae bacterium]|nr:YqaJ viral recombinase family protein [Stellaceae bacterium]